MIAAGNSVVFNPHPGAKEVTKLLKMYLSAFMILLCRSFIWTLMRQMLLGLIIMIRSEF